MQGTTISCFQLISNGPTIQSFMVNQFRIIFIILPNLVFVYRCYNRRYIENYGVGEFNRFIAETIVFMPFGDSFY